MKKQTKYVVIMLAVLALAGAVYGGLLWWNSGAEEREAAATIWAAQLDSVTELSVTPSGGETLTFVAQDGVWSWAGDSDFPVKQSAITAVTDLLTALEAEQTIENPDALADYGLEEPSYVLSGLNGEVSFRLSIGNKSAGGTYYVSVEGDPAVYTVAGGLALAVDFSLLDVCQTESLPAMNASTVQSVTIGGSTLEKVTDEEEASAWYLDGAEVDSGDYMTGLSALSFTGCAAFKPEDPATFGLDEASRTEVTVELEDETVVLWLGSADGAYYAMLPDGNLVYTVDGDAAAGVMDLSQLTNAEP